MANAFDFFLKSDETKNDHMEGYGADDLDTLISERDGSLVAVAQRAGVHVCWQCFKQFVHAPSDPKRPVEMNPGGHGTRILIHSGCVDKAAKTIAKQGGNGRLFWDGIGRHRARRFLTQATKPFRRAGGGDAG
jgi:hypothetical protein